MESVSCVFQTCAEAVQRVCEGCLECVGRLPHVSVCRLFAVCG